MRKAIVALLALAACKGTAETNVTNVALRAADTAAAEQEWRDYRLYEPERAGRDAWDVTILAYTEDGTSFYDVRVRRVCDIDAHAECFKAEGLVPKLAQSGDGPGAVGEGRPEQAQLLKR